MSEVRRKILQYLYDNRGESNIRTNNISDALKLNGAEVIQESKYLIGKELVEKSGGIRLSGDFKLLISSKGIDQIESDLRANHDSLVIELTKVSRELKDELREAAEKANARGLLYSGIAINLKIDAACKLLEESLKNIVKIYNDDFDIVSIESYLTEKQKEITTSIKVHDPNSDHSNLVAARIDEVKGLVKNTQRYYRRIGEKNNSPINIDAGSDANIGNTHLSNSLAPNNKNASWWLQHIVFPILTGLAVLLIGVYIFGVGK